MNLYLQGACQVLRPGCKALQRNSLGALVGRRCEAIGTTRCPLGKTHPYLFLDTTKGNELPNALSLLGTARGGSRPSEEPPLQEKPA